MIHSIRRWFYQLRHYVLLDPADNSVTLSRALFREMQKSANPGDPARVFVFAVPEKHSFGFMLNPPIDQPTQLCDIQFNDRYHCVGFETLCPSVGRIYYDLGLPTHAPCRLSVERATTPDGHAYYLLIPPQRSNGSPRLQPA